MVHRFIELCQSLNHDKAAVYEGKIYYKAFYNKWHLNCLDWWTLSQILHHNNNNINTSHSIWLPIAYLFMSSCVALRQFLKNKSWSSIFQQGFGKFLRAMINFRELLKPPWKFENIIFMAEPFSDTEADSYHMSHQGSPYAASSI